MSESPRGIRASERALLQVVGLALSQWEGVGKNTNVVLFGAVVGYGNEYGVSCVSRNE